MPILPAHLSRPSTVPARVRALLATPALLLALTASTHADPLFSARYLSYDTGPNPESVAIADLNADGRPDLAVANGGSNTVSVLLGNGDGTFGPKTDFGTGSTPLSLAIADLNADGQPDLAVANGGSNTVSVLLGNGNGAFGARTDFDAGSHPAAVAIADLNGDGRPDLAVANRWSTVSVLIGNGDGTFGPKANVAAGISPTSVAIADLNGDAFLDLAVANWGDPEVPDENTVSVLLGNGDGTFGARSDFRTGSRPSSLAIADFNADGRPDLAVACNYDFALSGVSVLLGHGDGTFQVATPFRTGNGPWSVATADFNGDGRLDLVTANADSDPDNYFPAVSLLLGNGDGTFGARTDFPAGDHPRSLAIADLNADGQADLAVTNDEGAVSVLLGNAYGTFGTTINSFGAGYAWYMAVGDLNGDGRPDLGVANLGSNSVSVLLGNGDGTFGVRTVFATGSDPYSLAIADLNADGRLDMVTANYDSNTVSVLLGNGDGTFGIRTDFATGSGSYALAIADLNADGWPDLAVTGFTYTPVTVSVSVLLGNGDGTFGPWTKFVTGRRPYALAIADLNADGSPDLAVTSANDPVTLYFVSVFLGNGNGTFGPRSDFGTGNEPASLAIADLNADGRPDLAVANFLSRTVSVLLGNGDGTFGTRSDFDAGGYPEAVAVADLNADGRLDLAAAVHNDSNGYVGAVSVLLGNGDGSFGARTGYGCGSWPRSVAIADLDRDRRQDLMIANEYPGTVSVLLGTGDIPVPVQLSPVSAEATPDRVVLRWRGEGAASLAASVYRRIAAGDWEYLGSPVPEGADVVRYEDRAVAAGVRYTYRLGYQDGVAESFTSELEVEVPVGFRLALEGFRPNPAIGAPVVSFTLPHDSPTIIEVIDVAGRRVLRREMRGLGAGRHVVRLEGAERLAPGVYMVRLHQAGRTQYARGVVVK